MDKSKEYIEMCDCKEIQDGWKPECGDVVRIQWLAKYMIGREMRQEVSIIIKDDFTIIPESHLWLPRQDQLQGMLRDKPFWFSDFIKAIYEYDFSLKSLDLREYYKQFKSMEQLWLAFCMSELHNLTWEGERRWKYINVKIVVEK